MEKGKYIFLLDIFINCIKCICLYNIKTKYLTNSINVFFFVKFTLLLLPYNYLISCEIHFTVVSQYLTENLEKLITY